jgi:cysteine-rich repeat protein
MAFFRLVLVFIVAASGCGIHHGVGKGEGGHGPGDGGTEPRPGKPEIAGRAGSAPDLGRVQVGVPDAAAPDAAVADRCAGLRNACDEPSVTCSGDTLVTCAADQNGCLVTTRRNCTRAGTNTCDSEADPPSCAVDACAAHDNRCTQAGRSCDGATLINCAEGADGCLVATATDCTSVSGKNACGGEPADCKLEACRDARGQPKADVCATPDDSCAGEYWVHCVADSAGCLIATRTDCRLEPNKNHCDPAAHSCGFDPCKGVTTCVSAGKTCAGVSLVECAPNADGCLVKSTTDCTQKETQPLTCDASSGTPMCKTCNDAASCAGKAEGDTLCDGNVYQRCSDTDRDTCLNAVREECGPSFSCDPDATKRCVYSGGDVCTSAIAAVLREPMSYGPFDTSGAGNDYANYSCQGLYFAVQAASPDLLFALDVGPRSAVTLSLNSPAGFGESAPQVFLLTACADTTDVSAESTCRAAASDAFTYANDADTNARVYAVVDASRANNADSVGTFGLTLDVRPLVCGDGRRDGAEACDDGNVVSGDGCTPSCMRETGFSCTSSSPSICTQRPTNGICANVMCPALPSDAPANSETCCTIDQRCGIAYALFFGAGCLERDQEGRDDGRCPDAQSVFPGLIPALVGCCRADNTCGLRAATGAGCVERAEAWAAMADGFGDFLYPGPFMPASCSSE